MPINPLHFHHLNAAPRPAIWPGQPPLTWAGYIATNATINPPTPALLALLPATAHNRTSLRTFCAANNGNPALCVLACWAWGEMRRTNAVLAWNSQRGWLHVVNNLLGCAYKTRADAFDDFAACYNKHAMAGMGAAYFTKLIFFLAPHLNGYIMDQWTAKSINLLYDRTSRDPVGQMIDLNRAGYVTSKNTGADYENFCLAIEDVARHLRMTPSDAEERLMSNGSKGGRLPGAWRSYVRPFPI